MEIYMAIKVLINGIFMTMNLTKHLFIAISFKLVLNEVERNTAIDFSLHFSDHLNKTSTPVYRQPIFKTVFL